MLHLLQLQSVFLLTNLSQVYRSQGWSLWQQQGLGSLMPGVSTASWPPHNHWLATSARVQGISRGYLLDISDGVVRLWLLLSLAPFTSPLLLLWLPAAGAWAHNCAPHHCHCSRYGQQTLQILHLCPVSLLHSLIMLVLVVTKCPQVVMSTVYHNRNPIHMPHWF